MGESTIELPMPMVKSYPHSKLKSLPLRDQPAYRVTANAASCSLVELLAAVIGGNQQIEIAESVLAKFHGDVREIYRAHTAELGRLRGIGQQTAIRIKAALALGLRMNEDGAEKPKINCPADAAALVQVEMSLLEKECLKVMMLDTRNSVLEITEVYHGSVNSSQVRVGELFRIPLQRLASAIIVIHNHPSGDPTPSPDDVAVTRAIVAAGKLLDIDVLDHLIVGGNKFVSLKERGLGFN